MAVWDGRRQQAREHHGRLVFWSIFYSICVAVCTPLSGIALYHIARGETGYIVMLTVFGISFLLTGFQALHYLKDLRADPITVEGEIIRKWHKGNIMIFFLPSYYIYVEHKVLAIPREDYAMLLEDDLVRITCYPHSLTVGHVDRYDETEKKFIPATYGALD